MMDSETRDTRFPSATVFCNTSFLKAFQTSHLRRFSDSKTLLDLELKHNPEDVIAKFASFPPDPSREQYDNFMSWAFKELIDSDIATVQPHVPHDYTHVAPAFLSKVQVHSKALLEFVLDLKKRWSELCRVFTNNGDLTQTSLRSSLIRLPHPFFIPGGRFRECYYWDTLWIVKGLVASDMLQSAKGAVRNLLFLVENIGFVPNGNRVYYLNRSQPPTLTEAVKVVYDAIQTRAERLAWLQEAVPILDTEYKAFAKTHSISSVYPDEPFAPLMKSLSVYHVETKDPRPESFKEDFDLLKKVTAEHNGRILEDEVAGTLFKDLASGAESGWDFSSRWFSDPSKGLSSIQTSRIVPCCLNSILLRTETTLSHFHKALSLDMNTASTLGHPTQHTSQSRMYQELARERQISMNRFLWCDKRGAWFDYDLNKGNRTSTISCASLMPAWAGCCDEIWTQDDAEKFVNFTLHTSGLLQVGGLSCTTTKSKQQWDFPNCWAPLIEMAAEGLKRVGNQFPMSGATEGAEEIARRFVKSVFRGWLRGKVMHEKYDCRVDMGQRGTGGEYVPQTGFGWTNGSVLWLLREYIESINSTENWASLSDDVTE